MQQEAVFAGRYLLQRRAGAGGMGEVWKALDNETGQPLALKRLPAHDPGDATRFAREAQILAGLSHPHVVRYVAHGADADGAPFLAMEWLEGEDLPGYRTSFLESVPENRRTLALAREWLGEGG